MKPFKKIKRYVTNLKASFIKNVTEKSLFKDDSLVYWRANILFSILLVTLILSIFGLMAAVFLVIKIKIWRLLVVDSFAYGLAFYLIFSTRLKYEIRAAILVVVFYFVGLAVTVSVGPLSGGPLWLFAFAILTGILLGYKASLMAIATNGITLTIVGWLISTGQFGQDLPFFNSTHTMISAILNFIVSNLIASMSITVLVNGLYSTHQKEKELASSLDRERRHLISAKEKLEIEAVERKRIQGELVESEKKYRLLAENVNDIIWLMDISPQRITYISPSVKTVRGYSPEETIGQSLHDILTPDSYKKATTLLSLELDRDKKMDPDRFFTVELEQYRKDGSTVWTETTASFLRDSEQKPTVILGVSRDISERKLAEKELREKEAKLTRLKKMESLGLMAGGIAHDLNNILSGIVSYPDLLLADLPPKSPLRQTIKEIKESGLRASDVVSDLLTVARGIATTRGAMNLNTIIGEYIDSPEHKKLITSRPKITFETVLDDKLLNIIVSPTHIKKVLMNLAANAADAIKATGTVSMSTENICLDEPVVGYEEIHPGEYILLKVSDNGTGISPEDLQKIFEPFYTKKILKRGGTGLGLAVVWNTVKDHGGYINVKSNQHGTEFELYFPATKEQTTVTPNKIKRTEYLGSGEKILVVDDEEIQRKIACGLLTKLGYETEAVASGEMAIGYLKNNHADLILLDMLMSDGINGRETYEQIIEIRPHQKAIIASGYAETDDIKAAQRFGSCKYIKKPYTIEEIGMAIKKELGNELAAG